MISVFGCGGARTGDNEVEEESEDEELLHNTYASSGLGGRHMSTSCNERFQDMTEMASGEVDERDGGEMAGRLWRDGMLHLHAARKGARERRGHRVACRSARK